jgi:hypothetical protein
MMSPRESLEHVLELIEAAMRELDSRSNATGPLIQAHTITMIQLARFKRAELRATPAHETMQ